MTHTSRFLFVTSALLLPACGGGSAGGTTTTPNGSASYEGALTSTNVARGEHEFTEHCAGCHTEQAGAYGPRVANLGWTPAHMRQQIREGSGRMPGFGESNLRADDLEATLAYLVTIGGVTNAAPESGAAESPAAAVTP